MAVKKYKATTNGRRNMSVLVAEEITTKTPEKSLLEPKRKTGGRNNQGVITARHIGGGVRQKYRVIDFKRNKDNIPARVAEIEYDPNRSANIALLNYKDGEKRYILAPVDLKQGMEVISGEQVDIKVGNCLPLANIPVGTVVHNVELKPGRGGQVARSAGASCQIISKEEKYILLRLNSGEVRKFLSVCRATIGTVGNIDHELVIIGKAGRKRLMGIKPHVRGAAMNPVDHPHGGGEGRAPVGRAAQMTPWGKKARGVITRKKKNKSNKLIIRNRKGRTY